MPTRTGYSERREEILETLFGPSQEAEPDKLLEFAKADEETLVNVLEMPIAADNLATVQLCMLAAYQRDIQGVLERVGEKVEGFDDVIGELEMIDNVPGDEDPGSRFNDLASEPPSAQKILTS